MRAAQWRPSPTDRPQANAECPIAGCAPAGYPSHAARAAQIGRAVMIRRICESVYHNQGVALPHIEFSCYTTSNEMAPRGCNRRSREPTGVSLMTSPDYTPTKRCAKCGNEYPATPEYFHANRSKRDGLVSACKSCISHQNRERTLSSEDRERRRLYTREYRKRPDAMERKKASDAEYRSRPEVKKHHREYRREYDKRPDVQTRLYEREHSERVIARRKAYYSRPEVKERRQQYIKQYKPEYLKRPYAREKHNASNRAQGARRRGTVGSFNAADIESIRKAQGNRCYLCHKKLGKTYHVDHFIPIKLGGTNDPGNLRLACPKCNMSKNAKHPFELGILI